MHAHGQRIRTLRIHGWHDKSGKNHKNSRKIYLDIHYPGWYTTLVVKKMPSCNRS